MKNHNYYTYIIKCSDGSYYTGVTNDLDRRIAEHNDKYDPNSYTFSRRPVVLVFGEAFSDIEQAIAFEKQIKGWSRKKKEAIIANEWHKLPALSKNKAARENDELLL
jgi:putative endonuclease